MLLQFNFKNFKSFRDETTLDMTATKIVDHGDHVHNIGKERILPITSIFGANASGKTNVFEAFEFMASYVIGSFAFGGTSGGNKKGENDAVKPFPFLFDEDSASKETSFEVYFITSETDEAKTYNYGFVIGENGITEEWLNSKAKTSKTSRSIFYRNGDSLEMPGIPKDSRANIEVALEKEVLVVSLGSKLKISILKSIRDWFADIEFASFSDTISSLLISRQMPANFPSDKSVQKNVIDFFAKFDPSIVGFEVEKIEQSDSEDPKAGYFRIDALHKVIGSNKTKAIPLDFESSGTLKMFSLYRMLQDVLNYGGILFVDELNARLHPLLVRTFIISFLDKEINKNNAQLIFTTHDAWQLNSGLLRRDEIWFTEKSLDGVSTLYSLADFVDENGDKIRNDENIEKNYLLGKYGAIPQIKSDRQLKRGVI